MPFNIGPGELILVLVLALLVVGPGKLPDVGAAIGKSLREFRRAASDVTDAATLRSKLTGATATFAASAPEQQSGSTTSSAPAPSGAGRDTVPADVGRCATELAAGHPVVFTATATFREKPAVVVAVTIDGRTGAYVADPETCQLFTFQST